MKTCLTAQAAIFLQIMGGGCRKRTQLDDRGEGSPRNQVKITKGDSRMNTPWDIEGKWSVSHFGWSEDVRKDLCRLIPCTQRG